MEVIDNVISAYEAVKMNGVSQGIIALCSFIAVIIVIQKFVTAWKEAFSEGDKPCLLYTSPSPRDLSTSRMPSSA